MRAPCAGYYATQEWYRGSWNRGREIEDGYEVICRNMLGICFGRWVRETSRGSALTQLNFSVVGMCLLNSIHIECPSVAGGRIYVHTYVCKSIDSYREIEKSVQNISGRKRMLNIMGDSFIMQTYPQANCTMVLYNIVSWIEKYALGTKASSHQGTKAPRPRLMQFPRRIKKKKRSTAPLFGLHTNGSSFFVYFLAFSSR